MPPPTCCRTSSAMQRAVCACRVLCLAWLRRLKKYLRLSKGMVKRLRHLVNALRSLLRERCCLAPPAPSATGSSAEASTATMGGHNGLPTEPEAGAEPWCIIAYWELNERVGPLYHVQRPWLHVTFDERPSGSASEEQQALSLHELAAASACRDATVLRTRAHIGQGVTLLQERDGVWAYNRSEKALFVASPTLDGPSVRNPTVFKVPPGYSLRVFDWERARLYHNYPPPSCEGPSYAPYFARISFVKGWGPKYARQIVTSLPCSLELFFRAPPPR